MAMKNCCIKQCKSSSTRNEDKGVTYHKFPKDTKLREKWVSITQFTTPECGPTSFVCSRHFCKGDFKKNKDAKYILKSDAIPSIFSWKIEKVNMESVSSIENESEPPEENAANISGSSKGSETENVDNIKKFIEAQDRELQSLDGNDKDKPVETVENLAEVTQPEENELKAVENVEVPVSMQSSEEIIQKQEQQDVVESVHEIDQNQVKIVQPMENEPIDNSQKPIEHVDETMEVAASVMEMILNETEAKAIKTNNAKEGPKQALNPGNGSMPLSVGSKVEAKDFSEEWYPAEIAEVDFDEMEVLVHYNDLRKPDEWINVSSPRLRPFTAPSAVKPPEVKSEMEPLKEIVDECKEARVDERTKKFVVGERCLARWRDNRRFVATVDKDLGDGKFEVIFDDGVRWACSVLRLSKLKETLTIDTSLSSASGASSPVLPGGPNSIPPPLPAYHTHLFDPTRDYLGSKSERREKKRKINIKEIFNIGQKKPKMPKVEKGPPKEKAKKVVRRKVKKEVKPGRAMSDAVESIIGTEKEEKAEIKKEIMSDLMEVDGEGFNIDDQEDSLTSKSDLDPIDEEVKLERFDKPDQKLHEVVIDKIKEAIIKLEGGLNDSIKSEFKSHIRVESPKCFSTQKSEIDIDIKPVIDCPKAAIATPEPAIVVPKSRASTPKPTTLPIVLIERTIPDPKLNDDAISESEMKCDVAIMEMDVPSPSVIQASETDIEYLMHDSDATKSDLEFDTSIESPKLDIDKPILVDIEAPLDNDPEEVPAVPTELKVTAAEIKHTKKKVKKAKKRQLQEQNEVERVKNELAAIKQKYEEVKRQMRKEREKQQHQQQAVAAVPQPESALAAHEWACQWVNGQPVGRVSEVEADGKPDANGKPPLPRRSVQVVDRRLPRGWTKHMVRRSVGHSAGKWDVVLIGPNNKRFHTKTDMRHYLETADASVKAHEHALLDFGNHLKLSRKLGWISSTPDGIAEAPETILPATSLSNLSPLIKKKNISLKRRGVKINKRPIKLKLQRRMHMYNSQLVDADSGGSSMTSQTIPEPPMMPIEDGYVWVGSLKVQVIENLLRCPADNCFKNFRNNTLLQMHIKHYHRELRKMMGATPKVLDLAAARTIVPGPHPKDSKVIKVKINKPPKREEPKIENEICDPIHTPTKEEKIPRSQDSPKLRLALINKPKRPRVLLPMKRIESELESEEIETEITEMPQEALDFETAISTHTLTKPGEKRKKGDKKKSFASFAKNVSEDEEWFALNSDDVETRSSFPHSGSPDSKIADPKTGLMVSSDNTEDQMDDSTLYTFTETGERIKIVHMRREEIINCHCGFREEDGLMVQCELCLCWQHAICHNIHKESEVPEKYTCSICLNPRRGRRTKRFLHDQDRMYEGLLPGAKQDESVRRSHELAGNLLRIEDALHALRVKYHVATKKDHPKLYLWAKDWEQAEVPYKLNTDYSDLNIMINGMDKENLPLREEPVLEVRPEEDQDGERYSGRDALGSQALLSGLLSSPGAASLELPISTSELERLARTVQEAAAAEWQGQAAAAAAAEAAASAPQPEPPIENEVCRDRLLTHIQRCQALLDSRLDSIEAQVAELESQDPSFGEHYETAEKYPRIKQTVQMMLRDLDTMEELGVIT